MSFLNELKRRNVFRVGLVYLASAWLVAQVTAILVPAFGWPTSVLRSVIILLAVGLPIVLVVAWLFELTPEGLKRTSDVDAAQSIRPLTGRKLDRVLIGVLGLIVVVLLANQFLFERKSPTARESASQTSTPGTPTLAVLPFVDMSPNKDQGYFADGTADELLNALAQVKGLQVTGRTSSFSFKGKNEDLRSIGETLGVENILEGSVSKEGDKVRVIAQLINAKTGYHLWSETYDRKLIDIFAIQDDIAKSVAQALQITLGIGEFGHEGMTRNIQAYDEYLLGLAAGYDGNTDQAVAYAERALALDPAFSGALVELSDAYWRGASFLAPADEADMRRKADQALARAGGLTPNAPFVLTEEIVENVDRGNWLDADRLGKELFARSPQYAAGNAASSYGTLLVATGRVKEAVSYLEQARAVNPLDGVTSLNLGEAYAASGKVTAALTELDHGRMLAGPQRPINLIGLLDALASGDRAQIDKWSALVLKADTGDRQAWVMLIRFLDNRPAALTEIRHAAASHASGSDLAAVAPLAFGAAYYGDPALALDLLRQIPTSDNGVVVTYAAWHPLFRDARKLPAFKDLVRELGLVDYWRQSGHWGDFCHSVGDNDFACE